MSKNISSYASKRYVLYFVVTVVALILPFITINGNHFFLLSFDHKKLNLLFTAFDMQELYLMPFVLIIFFLGIFFLTTLGGRVWCGWACPQTIFRVIYRDLIQTKLLKIHSNLNNKQKKIEGKIVKRIIGGVIWSILAVIAASNLMWFFVPPEDFFLYLQNPTEHLLTFGIVAGFSVFLIFDVIFLKEKFCVFVCPYARVQSVMFDHDTIQVIYDENRGGKVYDGHNKLGKKPPQGGECIGCEACVHICPTHIDIRQGMQLDCINCLECVDACHKVMSNLKKPSLISWTSAHSLKTGNKVKYFRFRTIAYMVILTVAVIGLLIAITKKENMLLNINRTTQLYKVQKQADNSFSVENYYAFLLQNIDSKDHEYYFEVSDPRIQIKEPLEKIPVKSGSMRKFVVVLSTTETLVNDPTKDTPLEIKIFAFADDDKQNVNTTKSARFVFPKSKIIEEKLNE